MGQQEAGVDQCIYIYIFVDHVHTFKEETTNGMLIKNDVEENGDKLKVEKLDQLLGALEQSCCWFGHALLGDINLKLKYIYI